MEESKYWDRPRPSSPISATEMEPMGLFVSADVTSVEALLDDKHDSEYLSSQVRENMLAWDHRGLSSIVALVVSFSFAEGWAQNTTCRAGKIVRTADSETVNRHSLTVAINNKTDVERCH